MNLQLKRLFPLVLCLFCFGIATYGQGIKWADSLSWEQAKAKAKAENKYIFVDCYATWCGPCKQMDKDVYPLNTVGDSVNGKFISVKVQMDSTKNDSENVKKSYSIARNLEKSYNIAGLPTYLFFSPAGEIVHKAIGFQKPNDFIRLINDVRIPEKQLYTQIKNCREGKMDVNLVPVFIQRLNDEGDKITAQELARLYIKSHLEKLTDQQLFNKEHLDFMQTYMKVIRIEDRFFELNYRRPGVIDSIYGIGSAKAAVESIAYNHYVATAIDTAKKNNKEPDWKSIENTVEHKLDKRLSAVLLIYGKVNYYYWRAHAGKSDYENYFKYRLLAMRFTNLKDFPSADDASWILNGTAWDLFEYSFTKKQLEQGLEWVSYVIELKPSNLAMCLDTKANLLYKLGRNKEALVIQEQAVAMAPKSKVIRNGYEKMKRGEPTWTYGVKENKKVK